MCNEQVHISSGSYQIGYGELFNALFTGQADDTAATVIFNIRLPRLLSAVIAGVSLSVSGVVMQSIFRNPLVSPDLLGVSSGASLGTAVAVLLGFSSAFVSVTAFFGGIAAVAVTWLIAGLVPDGLPSIFAFLFGNLERAGLSELGWLFAVDFIFILLLWRLHFSLDVLSLGEIDAAGLGLPVGLIRNLSIVAAAVLCSTVVAKFGLIGWIGLVVPHMARLWFGSYRI